MLRRSGKSFSKSVKSATIFGIIGVMGMKTFAAASDSFIKLRNLMENANSTLEEFSEVVSCDPYLSAYVLNLVNSPFFGFSGQIKSVSRAVKLLGLGQLYDIVMGACALAPVELPGNMMPLPVVNAVAI